jgi:hypothetical protein
VAARQKQTVIVAGAQVRPCERSLKRCRLDKLPVEGLRLFVGPEPAEDDPVEQSLVRLGSDAAALGGEHGVMTSVSQQPPRHGNLGHIEIVVRKRDQDAHRVRGHDAQSGRRESTFRGISDRPRLR